jgi:hypothetical protein
MAKAQTKNVPAKQETTTAVLVQSELPDYIKQDKARGSENVTTDDLIIPRLELIQGLSPAVKRGDPGFIKGAMAGMFNNSVSRLLYGEECTIIPVHFSVQHIVWRDRKLARDLNISSEGGFFGAFPTHEQALERAEAEGGEDQAIVVIDTPTHLCLILNPETGAWEEIMIPMPKTKAKISRQWNSLVKLAGGDRFSRAYKLGAVLQKNDSGDFYNFSVELLGFPAKVAYEQAEALYESVSGGKMRTMDFADVVTEEGHTAEGEM